MNPCYLVTGGAGFIGSNLVHHLIEHTSVDVVVLDRLTYAGNPDNLASLVGSPRYHFVQGDICDAALVRSAFDRFRPSRVLHLAAESHVDRSIDAPGEFVRTNVVGTFELLQAARRLYEGLAAPERASFRFVHVSTDEVFGSLGPTGAFDEQTRYDPRSPYSSTKAGSDHLVRAYFHTYGVPTVITNCSNNYGPYQFPEKLIPLCTLNALEGKPLPVYGDGQNVRDWLFVRDHCEALRLAAEAGVPGQTYAIGGRSERRNIEIVELICALLDEIRPLGGRAATDRGTGAGGGGGTAGGTGAARSHRELITFVTDRPGHDRRYAIDPSKIERELGWRPRTSFEHGMRETVRWYLEHREWCERITSGVYRRERLGLSG